MTTVGSPRALLLALFTTAWLALGCGGSLETEPSLPSAPGVPDAAALGRLVLAQIVSPTVVAALDALPKPESRQIYQSIALWNDAQPGLTGTVEQACLAVEAITESAFGPDSVYRLLSRVGDNGQSTTLSFGRNLDPAVEQGAARCRDSLQAISATQSLTNRNPEVIGLLPPEVATMPKFHALRLLLPDTLPEEQRAALKTLRDQLSYPANGARLQKALKLRDMENYLNGTFDPDVFGFQAVASDVDNLTTSADLIEGLRLDYPGGFQGLSTVAILVWFQDSSFRLGVPYRAANGGDSTGDYPFTGNGFTATVRANAIPEWVLPRSGARLQDGSQLWTLDGQGNRVLVATLQGGAWVLTQTHRALPRPERLRLDRSARYRGTEVRLISQDQEFYHVHSPVDLDLIDQRHVGQADFRGKIPRTSPDLLLE